MASNPELERAIEKVVSRAGESIASALAEAGDGCKKDLDGAAEMLEAEYDGIISDGRKEAGKIERQLVGGADLAARNKELVELEEAVDRVFADALVKISAADHSGMAAGLLDEAAKTLGTAKMSVSTSKKSRKAVEKELSKFKGAHMSDDIECIGGIIARSADGSMTFDNTINARIDRMKPLIRKEIALKFGVGV